MRRERDWKTASIFNSQCSTKTVASKRKKRYRHFVHYIYSTDRLEVNKMEQAEQSIPNQQNGRKTLHEEAISSTL